MTDQTHFEKFASHILGDDESELGKVKAERDYALHCLEREIAICARTDAAFLAYLQIENSCEQTGHPCRERQKCGCYLEVRQHIDGDVGDVPK